MKFFAEENGVTRTWTRNVWFTSRMRQPLTVWYFLQTPEAAWALSHCVIVTESSHCSILQLMAWSFNFVGIASAHKPHKNRSDRWNEQNLSSYSNVVCCVIVSLRRRPVGQCNARHPSCLPERGSHVVSYSVALHRHVAQCDALRRQHHDPGTTPYYSYYIVSRPIDRIVQSNVTRTTQVDPQNYMLWETVRSTYDLHF